MSNQISGKSEVVIRLHQPGDIGWVIERHGVIYSKEFGWNEKFEALCAEVATKFLISHDAERERCWIAEHNGKRVGCVFLFKQSEDVAKLRLLLVEQEARGLGVGRSLVQECLDFARAAGYKRLTLWTNNVLHAARHLYEEAGLQCVASESTNEYGKELVFEQWDGDL